MQVKDSMNASNFLMVGNRTTFENNTSQMDKKNNEMDFASFLVSSTDHSNERKESEDVTKIRKNEETMAGSLEKMDKTEDPENVTEYCAKDEQPDLTNQVDQSAEIEESVKTDVKDNEELEQTILSDAEMSWVTTLGMTKEDQQDALEVLSSVLQMVMEQFHLSVEELDNKLKDFGMEMEELLTTDGVKEFFMNMENADVSDLLINENLNQKFQELMNTFHQVMDQLLSNEKMTESMKWNADVAAFWESSQDVKDFVAEKGVQQSEKLPDVLDEKEIIPDEPEVLISKQEGKSSLNEEKQDSLKQENSSMLAETKPQPVKETVIENEKGFENPVLRAIHDAMNQVQEDVPVMEEQQVSKRDVINQIVEQIRVNLNQDTTSMELQLYPEHLGKIQINVVSKDGIMTARIVAETENARQAIESGLSNLKETMEQQNLKVDAIEVMISTTGFEKQKEEQNAHKQGSGFKGKRKLDLSELNEDMSPSDEVETLKMQATGSSVSYIA